MDIYIDILCMYLEVDNKIERVMDNWLDSRFCNPRRDLWNIENFKLSQKRFWVNDKTANQNWPKHPRIR